KLIEAAETVELDLEVTGNFTLPVTFEDDITVAWSSNNAAIFIVSGNQAIVTRGSIDVEVTLTAVFTLNEDTHSIDIKVTVKAQEALNSISVEFTVTLPEDTPMTDDIYIAGDFGANSGIPSWDPGATAGKME